MLPLKSIQSNCKERRPPLGLAKNHDILRKNFKQYELVIRITPVRSQTCIPKDLVTAKENVSVVSVSSSTKVKFSGLY